MKLLELKERVDEFPQRIGAPGVSFDELAREIDRFEAMIVTIERGIFERDMQQVKEGLLGYDIEKLEIRTKNVRDEAKELEATDLHEKAHRLFIKAEELAKELVQLKQKLFQVRVLDLPVLKEKKQELEPQVSDLETLYDNLLKELDEREKQASIEDDYPQEIRHYLLHARIGNYYYKKSLGEHESLSRRAGILERAEKILAGLPIDPAILVQRKWPDNIVQQLIKYVQTLKHNIRLHLDDIHHIMSEGLIDKDIQNQELSLPFSMRKRWDERGSLTIDEEYIDQCEKEGMSKAKIKKLSRLKTEKFSQQDLRSELKELSFNKTEIDRVVDDLESKNRQAFYQRLWALNFLLLKDPDANKKLVGKVKSLLSLLNDGMPEKQKERYYAAQARRFLLMAGKGVIRELLEVYFNGLKKEEDYARLGEVLQDPKKNQSIPILLLQIAVNIPRLFDLALSTRFGNIYEERLKSAPVKQVTVYPELRSIDDFSDLQDVFPEEYDSDLQRFFLRISEGDVFGVSYHDEIKEQVKVGEEKQVEAQIYLLDCSGSMYGQGSGFRWFLRNAIFIAALNSFSVDATTKGKKEFSNLLFYRNFGTQVGDLQIIANQKQAFQTLEKFLNFQEDMNDTSLQDAIVTAYTDIRNTKEGKLKGLREAKRALTEAKVVVITDADQVQLHFPTLKEKQNVHGTNVVTHVFSLEKEDQNLSRLSRESAPGKAFYYYIQNALDPGLAALPPYGTQEEFSPLYPKRQFTSDSEREVFEKQVSELSNEIVEVVRSERRKREDTAKALGKELNDLLESRHAFAQNPYETGKTPQDTDKKKRRTQRVCDIITVLSEVIHEKMSASEVMDMFRFLANARVVIPKEYRAIFEKTGVTEMQKAIRNYRQEIYPKLIAA